MTENLLSLIVLVSPLAFIATAIASWFQPGKFPHLVKKLSMASASLTLLIATYSGFLVYKYGLLQSGLLGFEKIGLAIRIDPLSILMFGMIALLGYVVLKFSLNYLDGDPRQGAFIGRLTATIASVQLLVLSANLGLLFIAWVLTSLSLHRLLIFYPDRPRAIVAARKKFIMARLGDLSLLGAFILLYSHFHTGDLESIFQAIKDPSISVSNLSGLEVAAVLLALAAILKSAQFPTHGWLVEVMETPTPVSALLHAGLLNAGPFLISRMAFVMSETTYAPVVLIICGGFTGLFASVTFLTQPSVKTALGYSSVAHMGFMLMVCGLGVYPAAMLHLVAHSFYKAHSFLSSGSVIDVVRASKVALPKRRGSLVRIVGGTFLALTIYLGSSMLWGIDPTEELALLATGAIIVMGLSQMIIPALDSGVYVSSILRTCVLAIGVAVAFFSLEEGTHHLLHSQLPGLSQPGVATTLLIGIVVLIYGGVVFLQILAPVLPSNP
ncbi:MAG TPA: NADH/ubiquinone/plastoquinone (complex i), partial [Cryomorphaceae bacterium]|nr:NADH/ubiquinone/plastoquinone (complex i) [Cryomorphaceae bacterium]